MAAKRFEKKVYECWALEDARGELLPYAMTDESPFLFDSVGDTIIFSGRPGIPVRVTVERIAAKKPKGKS